MQKLREKFSIKQHFSWLQRKNMLVIENMTNTVLASAAHILKLERYREDQHGPCARMTRKFVKRSIFLYYSAIKKNSFESVLMRWMKLEPIIQSEVSQKEKHQYSILIHIYGIQKDGNNNPVYETAKETLMYRTVFWTLWERERVG